MWFKRRRFLVEKCKDANIIGILVCKLAGDQTKDIISRMKQLCRVNGKKSYIVSVGKPNVAKLANFPEVIPFFFLNFFSIQSSFKEYYMKPPFKHIISVLGDLALPMISLLKIYFIQILIVN